MTSTNASANLVAPTQNALPHSETAPSCDGLAGVVAARTRLSMVDGAAGVLLIQGHPVEEIAPALTFEQLTERLLETSNVADRMIEQRSLPPATIELLRANADADPMDALRMGLSSLAVDNGSNNAERSEAALAILAKVPSMIATHHRCRQGFEPSIPTKEPGIARDFLSQLTPETPPTEGRVRALNTYLNTVSDHGMNASTFTARVIISTRSDLVSALTGALGALKGPLHGGAPGPALDMVFDIGSVSRARAHLEKLLDRGERLMGFGHRIYTVRDPRADVLNAAAEQLAQGGDAQDLVELARGVEKVALELLRERKPHRDLQTNVEYYTALLLHAIGLSQDLFTPTFAVGRCVGWLAHCFEQLDYGRLIRPESVYVGPEPDERIIRR